MASFENQTPLNPQGNSGDQNVLVVTKNIGGQNVEFEVQYQAHQVSQQAQFADVDIIKDMPAAGHFHVDHIRVNGVYLPSGIRVKGSGGSFENPSTFEFEQNGAKVLGSDIAAESPHLGRHISASQLPDAVILERMNRYYTERANNPNADWGEWGQGEKGKRAYLGLAPLSWRVKGLASEYLV